MKKLILILAVSSISSITFAQTDSSNINKNLRYCAQLKDGILVVVSDQKEISSDITTENGTVIKANGNIIKKDGITTVMKDGECIDTQGLMVMADHIDIRSGNEAKKLK